MCVLIIFFIYLETNMFQNIFLICTTDCLPWGFLQNQTRFQLKWCIWEVMPDNTVQRWKMGEGRGSVHSSCVISKFPLWAAEAELCCGNSGSQCRPCISELSHPEGEEAGVFIYQYSRSLVKGYFWRMVIPHASDLPCTPEWTEIRPMWFGMNRQHLLLWHTFYVISE